MTTRCLDNYKTVITGGSDGIGFAIARAFAANGAKVWLVARNASKLERARAELAAHGTEVRSSSVDLCDPASVNQLGAEIAVEWESVNTLVNNAGIARFTPFEETRDTDLDEQVRVNLLAPYLLTRRLLPALRMTRGSVINISSSSAQRLIPGRPASVYAMTKGGINSLTKALALELGPSAVRVNAIAPGTIRTSMTTRLIESFSPERRHEYEKFVGQAFALGRLGEPDDVAAAAVYLASDAARWVTGAVFNVDGGLTTN